MSLLGPMVARSFIASTGPSRRGLAGVVSSVVWWAPEARAEVPPGERLCSSAVSHLAGEAGDVFLVGVAHVSNRSAELVRVVMRSVRPDLVMVELDASRVNAPPEDQRWIWVPPGAEEERKEPTGAIQNRGVTLPGWQQAVIAAAQQVLASALRLALQTFYQVIEQRLGVTAGAEMVAAAEEGVKVGAPILLGDRSSKVTLSRILEEIEKVNLTKVEEDLAAALPENPEELDGIPALQVALDSSTEQPTTRLLRRALKDSAPGVFNALVDERDAFMARNLFVGLSAGKRRIVAVIGSIHVQGIEERLVKAAKLQVVNTCFT